MTHQEIFADAKWIGTGKEEICPIIRDVFTYQKGETAHITILGLANFNLFINGKQVHKECFLPLNSEFEPRNHPSGEELGARAYPEQFDITDFLREGRNVIAVMLGNGWYNEAMYRPHGGEHPYGRKKVCWRIVFRNCTQDGVRVPDRADMTVGACARWEADMSNNGAYREFVSGTGARWLPSYVAESTFNEHEIQDFTDFDFRALQPDFDDSELPYVVEEIPLATDYDTTDCPRDKVIETVIPAVVGRNESGLIYDIGRNTTGYPIIKGTGKVLVTFCEKLAEDIVPTAATGDGDAAQAATTSDPHACPSLDPQYIHKQYYQVDFGSRTLTTSPKHMWFAFRYFQVEGDAQVTQVDIIHSDVAVTSCFNCDNETLNWLYKAYINTQLANMHGGIPSDCPHIERRGYTGDGQLACRAAMLTLDSRSFYDKWIRDISDGQDRLSGHIQYTAPYVRSGGGPGGWGCAIVQLPYQFWKFYGDDSKIKAHYDQMLHYFNYLEAHSENCLVTSDREGAWCLGDWCTPAPTALPAPFVNNYFYIKSLLQVIEIAAYLGRTEDIPMLQRRLKERKSATKAAYFNTWDSRFLGDYQGADAFALDIGLGNEITREKMVSYYEALGHYDTGIFGTDILTRLLFEMGENDLAFRLMTAGEPHGIGEWRKRGLTTTPEYWTAGRSLSHPMYGAVSSNLFEYVLGIRQSDDSVGYDNIVIAPAKIAALGQAQGHITTRHGKIAVAYLKDGNRIRFEIEIPDGVKATFSYENVTQELSCGTNRIELSMQPQELCK